MVVTVGSSTIWSNIDLCGSVWTFETCDDSVSGELK